ncbi:MAG: hypothetical protein SNJ71_04485, partial [Bacteroidales bacterium]
NQKFNFHNLLKSIEKYNFTVQSHEFDLPDQWKTGIKSYYSNENLELLKKYCSEEVIAIVSKYYEK